MEQHQSTTGMETRARRNLKLITPDQRGWRGKKVETKVQQMWNKIPSNIKFEHNAKIAKNV